MADIVRAVYYITDPKNADAVLTVCGETLGDIRPAATLLVVAGLYKPEMLIEIEVTAKVAMLGCAMYEHHADVQ